MGKERAMGTDIHTVAEVQDGERWRTVRGDLEDGERCYNTFGVLACVRGDARLPILDEPRGLPEGYTQESARPENGEEVWLGEHSHSWFLLSELQAYWEAMPAKTGEQPGVVDRETYRALVLRDKAPKQVSEGAGAIRDPRLDDPKADPYRVLLDDSWTHIETVWPVPGRDQFGLFPMLLEKLQDLQKEFGVRPDQVRLVFGFDS